MSKLVVESSLINWPIKTIPEQMRHTKQHPIDNPESICRVRDFIEGSLKDNDQAWKRHLNNECSCKLCSCGKHMCKLNRLKPLGKHQLSDYKINYKKHPRMNTSVAKFSQQMTPSKGVVTQSTYNADFQQKNSPDKKLRLKYADNLSIGGPFFVGTSYKQEYYPKISTNIGEIRMPNNGIFAMNIPLNAKSSYHDNFRQHKVLLTQSFKPKPRVRQTMSLQCGSTYKDQFKLPSIDAYKKYQISKSKKQQQIDHINKRSQYQAEFVPNALDICPAVQQSRKKSTIVNGK